MSSPTVKAYIDKRPAWRQALMQLRHMLLKLGLEETIKWASPVYTLGGKNVVGLAAFKDYYGLWFFQGALLHDPEQRLVNAQVGRTRAMRQLRFESLEALDLDLAAHFVEEAIRNEAAGLAIERRPAAVLSLPGVLSEALTNDPQLATQFGLLTLGRQREYAEHIGSAKREETCRRRLNTAIPLIMAGRGLHDRYR
jgi:uncharacterized protein YdeI (YjbR/CyaY-like superfamily)